MRDGSAEAQDHEVVVLVAGRGVRLLGDQEVGDLVAGRVLQGGPEGSLVEDQGVAALDQRVGLAGPDRPAELGLAVDERALLVELGVSGEAEGPALEHLPARQRE